MSKNKIFYDIWIHHFETFVKILLVLNMWSTKIWFLVLNINTMQMYTQEYVQDKVYGV